MAPSSIDPRDRQASTAASTATHGMTAKRGLTNNRRDSDDNNDEPRGKPTGEVNHATGNRCERCLAQKRRCTGPRVCGFCNERPSACVWPPHPMTRAGFFEWRARGGVCQPARHGYPALMAPLATSTTGSAPAPNTALLPAHIAYSVGPGSGNGSGNAAVAGNSNAAPAMPPQQTNPPASTAPVLPTLAPASPHVPEYTFVTQSPPAGNTADTQGPVEQLNPDASRDEELAMKRQRLMAAHRCVRLQHTRTCDGILSKSFLGL